jgi:hypothetical protein
VLDLENDFLVDQFVCDLEDEDDLRVNASACRRAR